MFEKAASIATSNRFDRMEAAGAFGDLGTLVPFVVAYLAVLKMDASSVLFAFGISMLVCGFIWLAQAGASLAAENGATVHELMAIFGWLTMKEAERYTQAARRRRLARNAGHLLVRTTNETSPHNDREHPRAGEGPEKQRQNLGAGAQGRGVQSKADQ
jgi:hypothetical protein